MVDTPVTDNTKLDLFSCKVDSIQTLGTFKFYVSYPKRHIFLSSQ